MFIEESVMMNDGAWTELTVGGFAVSTGPEFDA